MVAQSLKYHGPREGLRVAVEVAGGRVSTGYGRENDALEAGSQDDRAGLGVVRL